MKTLLLAACAVAAASPQLPWRRRQPFPPTSTAAVADKGRADDTNDDARRHLAEVVAFSGVKPGDKVVDLIPGSGYFTKVFSKIVGPKGHVFMIWPNEYAKEAQPDPVKNQGLARDRLSQYLGDPAARRRLRHARAGGPGVHGPELSRLSGQVHGQDRPDGPQPGGLQGAEAGRRLPGRRPHRRGRLGHARHRHPAPHRPGHRQEAGHRGRLRVRGREQGAAQPRRRPEEDWCSTRRSAATPTSSSTSSASRSRTRAAAAV